MKTQLKTNNMVSKERIKEENLTAEDVMDRELVEPEEEVSWVPEWDEAGEEAPGENTRIEDGTLIWERDGFEARLESHNTTHWRAEIQIPEGVGEYYPRPIDLKSHPRPEHGFVKDVDTDGYAAVRAVLIIKSNFQPTWEVNAFIDDLIESKEKSDQFREELTEKMELARRNEE